MSDPLPVPPAPSTAEINDDRLREIELRANAGEYHCREHFGQIDADDDVLFLLAIVARLRAVDHARAATEAQHQQEIEAFERNDHDREGAALTWHRCYQEAVAAKDAAEADRSLLREQLQALQAERDEVVDLLRIELGKQRQEIARRDSLIRQLQRELQAALLPPPSPQETT